MKDNFCENCAGAVDKDRRDQRFCSVGCRMEYSKELASTRTEPKLKPKGRKGVED